MNEFAVRSRRVLWNGETSPRPGTLLIRGGKIAKLLPFEADHPKLRDVGNHVVMPGIVDTHAHINEPGRTDWEGFQTATQAAAAGGITTVIDMPLNSIPATTTLEALQVKARTAEGKCAIDYGFWGGVVPGNAGELEPMVAAGAMGFKAFLCESGVDEFPMSRERDLREAMPILARAGVPLLVHAELENGVRPSSDAPDTRAYADYLHSRPKEWEVQAIRLMIRLAEETRCHVHIVHLSAADALSEISGAKARGVPITAETCPHYLYFEAETIHDGATQFKCAPPIRDHENREKLWRGLEESVLEFVVSDHSPCTPNLKLLEAGDFSKAWGGISGLQFSFPVVWTEMKRRGFSLSDISRLMSANTARFAGLEQRKGRLAEGFDADLVIWDPEHSFEVRGSEIFHKNKVTPYEGCRLFGRIHQTYLRGECVYDDGRFPAPQAGQPVSKGKTSK